MNAQLARYLKNYPDLPEQPFSPAQSSLPAYHARLWRVRDRLSEQDITEMVRAFKAGTAKHVLAKQYGIAIGNVKKLQREESVRRKSWKDRQT